MRIRTPIGPRLIILSALLASPAGAELEPVLAAPMPCDVVFYMKELRLPELPVSLREN